MSCRYEREHNDDAKNGSEDEKNVVDRQHRRACDWKPEVFMEKGDKRKYGGEKYSDSKDGEYYLEFFHRVHTYLF